MAKNLSIRINAEDKASAPIDKVSEKINTLSNNLKQSTTPLTNLGKSLKSLTGAIPGIGLVTAAVAGVTAAVKKTVSEMKQWEEAFANVEQSAKRINFAARLNEQLEVSGKNLINFSSELSNKLKDTFAGGDIQNAIAGLSFERTGKEIKQIIEVAADLSVALGQDLNTTVSQLNSTFSGTTGQLGKLFPELKNLSKEALASGEAINVISSKVRGMAEEMTNSLQGSILRSKNLSGDLKEELGYYVKDFFDPIRRQISDIKEKWRDALASKRTLKEAQEARANKTATEEDWLTLIENLEIKRRNEVINKKNRESAGFGTAESEAEILRLTQQIEQYNKELREYNNLVAQQKKKKAVAPEATTTTEATTSTTTTTGIVKKTTKAFATASEYVASYAQGLRTTTRLLSEESAAIAEKVRLAEKEKAQKLEELQTARRQVITGSLGQSGQIIEAAITGDWASALLSFASSFLTKIAEISPLVSQLYNVVDTLFNNLVAPFLKHIEPFIAPIVSIVQSIGSFVGSLFALFQPFVDIVSPILKAIGYAVAWTSQLVNSIMEYFKYFYTEIYNWFTRIYNHLVSARKERDYKTQEKTLEEINTGIKKLFNGEFLEEYRNSLLESMTSNGTSSVTGGSASYSAARDVFVTININGFVNGDSEQIAVFLAREIKRAERMNLV